MNSFGSSFKVAKSAFDKNGFGTNLIRKIQVNSGKTLQVLSRRST